jgi:glyoxylase-like metal-dependent hydrolase (beta-lactamase superfamily II)
MRPAPEITPTDLARALEAGEPYQILDVRLPTALANGRIDLVPPERFRNLVGSRVLTMRSFPPDFMTPDAPVAVVCNHGNSSRPVTAHLNHLGFQAVSVSGGMSGWMRVVVPRELPAPEGFDRLIQLDRVGKGALGYVLVSAGEALVVDPALDASASLEAVERAGARIVGVADTHVHADYVSGAPTLAQSLRVPYYLHSADAVSPYDGRPGRIAYTPLAEGGTIRVGRGAVRILHTPGHTEGSVTFEVGGGAALTGDFIFVRSVGRPDLGGRTEEWTPVLWRSIERARSDWPGALRIHPAHYSGSDERENDRTVGRPFDVLQITNEPLRMATGEEFAAWVLSRAGAFPEAYRTIKGINLGLIAAGLDEIDVLECGRNACALG